MHILGVYATERERGPLADASLPMEWLRIGIGPMAASHALTRRMHDQSLPRPDVVLSFGVAGAYRGRGLGVGDVCVVIEDQLADLGTITEEGFLDLRSLDPDQPTVVNFDHALSQRAAEILQVPTVTGATVSTCSATTELEAERQSRTGATVETMEGATIPFCCAGARTLHIRAVSNLTGPREDSGWDLEGALTSLHAAVRTLTPTLG